MAKKNWDLVKPITPKPVTTENKVVQTNATATQPQTNKVKPLSVSPRKDAKAQVSTPSASKPSATVGKPSATSANVGGLTPAQRAANTPTVLPGGSVVTPSKSPGQVGAETSNKNLGRVKKTMAGLVDDLKLGITAESIKGKSPSEMYTSISELTRRDSQTGLSGSDPMLRDISIQLSDEYEQTVKPSYEAYVNAQKAYDDGSGSWANLMNAYNAYVDVYNNYQPRVDAWSRMNGNSYSNYWNDEPIENVGSALALLNTAITDGGASIEALNQRLQGSQSNYDSLLTTLQERDKALENALKALDVAEKAYKSNKKGSTDQYKTTFDAAQKAYSDWQETYDAAVQAGHELSKLQGQYNAELYYLSEITGIAQYGSDTWRRRYLSANPSIAWGREQGYVTGDAFSIQEQLKEYQRGGGVDLLHRPEVDASQLAAAGWKDAGEGTATVFTSTFSNYDFMDPTAQERTDIRAANFTPIAVDKNGNVSILSPEELAEYARGVLIEGKPDDLGLRIGNVFNGADALSDAERTARNIHELHEIMISGDYTTDAVINDLGFTKILSDIRKLKKNNSSGSNDAEIAYYYKLLNSGMWEANLTPDEYDSATKDLNTELEDAKNAERAIYERYRQQMEAELGRSLRTIDEMKLAEEAAEADPEMKDARARQAEAQKWLQQLRNRKYNMTYEHLIDKMPDYLNEQIEQLINVTASSSSDASIWETVVRGSLANEGLSEEQVDAVMNYATREANRIRDERVQKKWYDWSMSLGDLPAERLVANMTAVTSPVGDIPAVAQQAIKWAEDQIDPDDISSSQVAATLINWPLQLVSSLGQIVSAADLTVQGANNLASNNIDPYTGEYVPIDFHTAWQAPYTVNKALNDAEYDRAFNALYEDLGDAELARKKAQTYMTYYDLSQSMGQSTVVVGMSMLGVPGSLILLSGSAAASTMHEMHDAGYSDGYAITAGLASGFAEYITEKVSIESLMKVSKAGLKSTDGVARLVAATLNIGSQYISEASEEGASDVVNLMADYYITRLLNGGISQIEMDALKLQEQEPSLSWEDALHQCWTDWAKQTGMDMWYGGISGGIFGAGGYAVGTAVGNARTSSAGADVRNAAGQGALMDYANAIDTVVNSLTSSNTSDSLASGMDTDYQLGLAKGRTMDARVLAGISSRLSELGETDVSADLIRGINALATDDRLTVRQKRAVSRSRYAHQVADELTQLYENEEIAGTHPEVIGSEWVRDLQYDLAAMNDQMTNPESAESYNQNRANTMELLHTFSQPAVNVDSTPTDEELRAASEGLDAIQQGISTMQDRADSGFYRGEQAKNMLQAFEGKTPGRGSTRRGTSPLEFAYREAQTNNPDASVLNPLGDAIQKAGATPETALRQGQLMAIVLSGDQLTASELSEFDLNNKAVRDVFMQRTGLTGMPSNVPTSLKRAYVNRIISEVSIIKTQQEDLGRGSQMLLDLAEERSKARTKEIEKTIEARQRTRTEAKGRRAENKQARAQRVDAETAARIREAQRNDPVDLSGKTAEQVIQEVADRANISSKSIPLWVDFLADYNRVLGDESTEESANFSNIQAQGEYLTRLMRDLKLTAVEAEAVLTAQRGTEYTEKAAQEVVETEKPAATRKTSTIAQAKNALKALPEETRERLAEAREQYAELFDVLQQDDAVYVEGRETPVMRVSTATSRWIGLNILDENGNVIGDEWVLPDSFTTGETLQILDSAAGYRVVDAGGNEKLNIAKEVEESAERRVTRVLGGGVRSGLDEQTGGMDVQTDSGTGEGSRVSGSVGNAGVGLVPAGDPGRERVGETTRGNTYSVDELGPVGPNLSDTKNLHLLSPRAYINSDGMPGDRADLYYGHRTAQMMGATDVHYVYTDPGIPGSDLRGLVSIKPDGSLSPVYGATLLDGSIVVALNPNGMSIKTNPVRTACHEGYHIADEDYRLTRVIVERISADPELKAQLDTDITERSKTKSYTGEAYLRYASELFADTFAGKGSVKYTDTKDIDLSQYFDTVLDVVRENVAGFDQMTYDLTMRQALRFGDHEYRQRYINYVLNEALYKGMEGEEAEETETLDKESLLKGKWDSPLFNLSKLPSTVSAAPEPSQNAKSEPVQAAQTPAQDISEYSDTQLNARIAQLREDISNKDLRLRAAKVLYPAAESTKQLQNDLADLNTELRAAEAELNKRLILPQIGSQMSEQPKHQQTARRVVKRGPRAMAEKIPTDLRETTRENFLKSELRDTKAEFVDLSHIRSLARTESEVHGFDLAYSEMKKTGANFVFVNTSGAKNSKRYSSEGSPTARLEGAVTYITVQKGDTIPDIITRMQQGLFDQINRVLSKNKKAGQLVVVLNEAMEKNGVDVTALTNLAETVYTQLAWDLGILYDCYYETSNPSNPGLSLEDVEYAQRVNLDIGADKDTSISIVGRVYNKAQADAMNAKYREWALYQFYRDVMSGVRNNSEVFSIIEDTLKTLKYESRLRSTWAFERRLSEENKRRLAAREKWLAENTFSKNKNNLRPLSKNNKAAIIALLTKAGQRATQISELTQKEATLAQKVSDLSTRIAQLKEGLNYESETAQEDEESNDVQDFGVDVRFVNSVEDLNGPIDVWEDSYLSDPRFIALLDEICKAAGITDRTAAASSYDADLQRRYTTAWNQAVKRYSEEFSKAAQKEASTDEDVTLTGEDSELLSDARQQELITLRGQLRQVRLDLIEARAAAEGVRDNLLKQIKSLPYQTLAAQMFDDVSHGRMTSQEALDLILNAQKRLQSQPDLTVEEIAGRTIATNYRTNYREPSLPEYKAAENEIKEAIKRDAEAKRQSEGQAMFEEGTEEAFDYTQPTELERNASVLARGDTEKAEQIRESERALRDRARREDDLKTVKDMKNEAGKTDSDRSEVTPTTVRNNLLDELDAAEADLLHAPTGYSKGIQRVASKSAKAEAYMRKHARRAENAVKGQTLQEGSPLWNGTGNINQTEKSRKDAVLERIKSVGNSWMYQTYSDCWGLEKFAMKQTRIDNARNLINLVRGSNETTQFIYTSALVDRSGNYIGKAMKDVMVCWDGQKVDTEKQTKLQRYLLLMHTVDRMSVEDRALQAVLDYEERHPELKKISPGSLGRLIVENNNPIAKEYFRLLQWEDGAENKPVLAVHNGENFSEMNAVTAQSFAEQMLEEDPWLAQKAQEIYDWWDMFMREWGAGGRMSSENYENMRRAYPHYIPTYRAGDDRFVGSSSFRGSSEISTGPVIHAAKGSTLEILPFEDQFAMLASQYVQGARANELAWNFMQELLLSGEANGSDFSEFGQIDYDRTAEDFINERMEDDADPMSRMIEHDEGKHEYRVNCWVDGKQVSAYVSKEIYQSFQNLLKKQSATYKNIVAAGNRLTSPMKTFITGANPSFALRNIFADIPTAMINSITNSWTGVKFMNYWFKAWDHIGRDSDQWQQFQALGGTHANIVNPNKGFSTETSKKRGLGGKFMDVMATPGEYSESVTRFAEYLATIDRLGDTMEGRMAGIHNAAEITVDFGRGGYSTRALNSWSPYFNPAVQGIYKVIRGVVENKGWDRAKYLMRVGATTLPVELLMAMIRGMAGREKDFEEESDYLKDNYYLIPMGGKDGHNWFKIRKNREWAALFGNFLMRSLEAKNGYEDPYGTWLPISIQGNFLPDTPLPIFLQWALDAATNKNFAGSTIVPSTFDDFKDERPMDVYDEETTVLAYGIASVASKIFKRANPMFVDYILDYYGGDFWTNVYSWLDLGLVKEVKEADGSKTLTFAEGALEMLTGGAKELRNDWVTNSLYSNSTMTRYYDMVKKLKANTGAEKYQNGGKSTGSLDEQIYEALYYTDLGYASQITALAKEARTLPEGPEKDEIKKQQILLAHAAMEFYNQCVNGEIADPMRHVRYGMLDPKVSNELIRLSDFTDQFEYEPSFSRVSSLSDPDNKGYHFTLSDEQKDAYVDLWRKNYSDMVASMMRDTNYRAAPDSVKAMMLAQKRTEIHSKTNADFVEQLKKQGQKSTKKTLEDIEILQLEAQYALARANDPSTAVSSRVSDELIRMREYGSDYSFVMSTSVPKTFSSSNSSDSVYVLNSRQQDYYTRLRSSLYNEAMESILLSPDYKSRSGEEKAAMLQEAAQLVNKQLKNDFGSWISQQTDASTRERKNLSQEALELDAEFAVTRVLTPNNAYSREVTDELVRLYSYSDAYSFSPSTYVPSEYSDPNKKGYKFYLTADQKKKYQEFAHNIYDNAFKEVMRSSDYRNAKNDEERAALLDAMRGELSTAVRKEFLAWLAKNGKSKPKPDTTEEKALANRVKKIVGWS